MLAQGGRIAGGALDRSGAGSALVRKPVASVPGTAARKLSFKDKHALEQLPGKIVVHESEIVRLRHLLTDPGLYNRDPKAFAATTDALDREEAALRAAEERWLELEVLREQLAS